MSEGLLSSITVCLPPSDCSDWRVDKDYLLLMRLCLWEVLSSEMNPAEIRLILKDSIKGRGTEIFCEFHPPHYGMFVVLVAEGPGGVGCPNSGKSVPTIFHLL
jgi:hypothetical protein